MSRTLENPVTRERIVVLDASPDRLRLVEEVPVDMIRPPVHLHLGQHERFEVLQGQATIQLRNQEHVLEAGESITVAPRVPHTWWNSGPADLRMLSEFTPAGNMLSFFETYCGFARDGRADRSGAPPFLQVARSCGHWDMYLATPPVPIQKTLFALLNPVARLRGYRPRYERYERAGEEPPPSA